MKLNTWIRPLVIIVLLFVGASGLRAEYFVIDHYNIVVRLSGAQTFEVTETIKVTYSIPRHGIYRDIPLCYNTVEGKRNRILISGIGVEGFKKKITREGCNLNIRIGDEDVYVEGEQTYIIRYTVDHGFLYEPEHTEFYWNLIGERWTVPIFAADFQISLPDGVTVGAEDIKGFAGLFGTQQQNLTYQYDPAENVITGRATEVLQPGDALTMAVRLPKEAIAQPGKYEYAFKRYGLLGIPIAMLLGMFVIFVRYGWDKPVIRMVEFYPPEELTPSEAGAFIDDRPDSRDIIALIPLWGAQGYLEMVEKEKSSWLSSKPEFELAKLKDLPGDRPDYEKHIFSGLFDGRNRVELSELKNEFYTTMGVAKKKLQEKIKGKNLYTKSSLNWNNFFPTFYLIGAVGIIVAIVMNKVALLVSFFPVIFIGLGIQAFMLRKNDAGRKLYQKVYGFKMFVEKAEKDKLQRLLAEDPLYFDKTLPYAVAFGLTKKWTNKFSVLITEPPRWYVHHGTTSYSRSFDTFSSSFGTSINTVQSAFTSSPSSSGGGSSGGGGGGGGGGSW